MKVRQSKGSIDFPRRRFLRNAAVVSGASAAVSAVGPTFAQAAAGTPKAAGVVSAAHWGAFRGITENGRFTQAVPIIASPADPMVAAIPGVVYSPTRVQHPYVRRGYLEQGPTSNKNLRGRDEWVRVSWDKALDLVAGELARVRKQHGPLGIYGGSYGWKSVGTLHNARVLLHRMLNLGGGFVGSIGDYSTGAAQVILPHVVGSIEVYEQQTVWPVVHEHTKLVVVWGADPMNTLKVSWTTPDFVGYEGFDGLRQKGVPVVVIDPLRTETAKKLMAEWIPIRQRTDVAMMLGMMHTLHVEKLYDRKFVDEYTVGFDRFEPYLLGTTDKTPKSAEWASAICGVPAEQIRALARRMAKTRTMIMAGWSIQRQKNGEQAHWALVALASMLGQIGLPGGGFGFSYHYSSGGSPTATGGTLAGITAGAAASGGPEWLQGGGSSAIPLARIADMLLNPGKQIQFNGRSITYPDIKLVYWSGGNPFSHQQDTARLVQAFRKPETIVVNEIAWTATARMADIVLPATTAYERNDVEMGGDYSNRYIFPMHKIVDPVAETRNDFDIFAAIADRLSYRDKFTEGRSETEWLKQIYGAAAAKSQRVGVPMPGFDEFWASGDFIEFPVMPPADQFVRYGEFREDPELNALGTPSGKIEIYSDRIAKMAYPNCGPHPRWYEPSEWWRSADAKKFPLGLLSAHPRLRLHSQLANTPLREKYTVAGREPMWIHPQDAAARKIKSGDVVQVSSPHGTVLAGAVVTDDVRPGYVQIAEGGWYDPVDPGNPQSLCKYGCVNVLVEDIPTSQLADGNCGQSGIVQVKKYEGKPPPVTVFQPPKGVA